MRNDLKAKQPFGKDENRPMRDTYGREVRTLRLAVTETCDLRCQYCMPPQGLPAQGNLMPADMLEAIAVAAADYGITKIRLTGGEPLFRSDIVDICKRIGRISQINTLCVTTNGTRLAALAGSLKEAGVARINLSLDSLKDERYAQLTRGGKLSRVLQGLDVALHTGFERIKINCVLMGGINDDEIADFVTLTKTMAVDVRFIELMPMGECASWPKERFLNADEVLARCPELAPVDVEGVARRYRLPDAKGTVGLIRPMSHAFCGDCDRVRITADGMLKPCLHSGMEIDLKGLTGQALTDALVRGIGAKPAKHHLSDGGSETERRMSQIGG